MNNIKRGLERFTINTIDQYKMALRVKDWIENIPIKESDLDDSFTQIAIHPLIEDAVFQLDNDIYPGIFGLERSIVLGEMEFFVSELLKKKTENNTVSIEKENINPIYLENQIGDWNASIVVPVDILYGDWLKNPVWLNHFNLFTNKIKFKKSTREISMFAVTQNFIDDIKNLVIIYDLDFTKWKYVKFKNKLLERDERLYIKIGDVVDDRRDVLIRTVNKIVSDQNYLKFIELI